MHHSRCACVVHSHPAPQEVNELKADIEKAKNEVVRSVIAIVGTFSAITFTVSRLMSG